jgi:hypothetical protein
MLNTSPLLQCSCATTVCRYDRHSVEFDLEQNVVLTPSLDTRALMDLGPTKSPLPEAKKSFALYLGSNLGTIR